MWDSSSIPLIGAGLVWLYLDVLALSVLLLLQLEKLIQKYGFVKGGAMGAKRIGRCHPWHPGGYDPVPGASADEIPASLGELRDG